MSSLSNSNANQNAQGAEDAAIAAAVSAADAEIAIRNVLLIVLPALCFAFLAGIAIWAYMRHCRRRPNNPNDVPRGRSLDSSSTTRPMTTTRATLIQVPGPASTRNYQSSLRSNSARITGLRTENTTHRPVQGLNEFGEAPPPYNSQVKADEEVLLSQWAPGHPLPSTEMLQRQLDVQREYEQQPGLTLDPDLERGETSPLPAYESNTNTNVPQIPIIMVECVDANSPTSPRPVHLP
ncbi:hypothetical protein CFIMG_007588RA00001 [Ceratocystis fimbriata CBS 114723]|uniref:Transmembrane protein n=1 Tax=Ceratocystis fimbriata CBS 114723 TaxID=1035309 RepID=A0A2C5XF13_9PEZI|nr:hypothetical protein CFIMG_007588RA00001 [Ceratocystis fimbriata CBS 114723]